MNNETNVIFEQLDRNRDINKCLYLKNVYDMNL